MTPTRRLSSPSLGSEYTSEETELLRAIDHYKRGTGRVRPTPAEILAIARACGWRKAAAPVPLPRLR